MQTSEHIIAYQTVSRGAYHRLRETLLQQAHSFDSVDQADEFVLMRSVALNVLLTAVGLAEGKRTSAERETAEKSANVSPEDTVGEYRVGLTFDDQAIAVFTQRLSSEHLRSESSLFSGQSSSQEASSHDYARQVMAVGKENALGLGAISNSSVQSGDSHQHAEERIAEERISKPDNAETTRISKEASISKEDRLIAQKSFVLGWAKNLAASPEGDTQPSQTALDHQLQQSLLLDQVITRIRHSLDLPAILETTVAQVREFLSADRLVLYQFDQFELVGEVSPQRNADNEVLSAMKADTVTSRPLASGRHASTDTSAHIGRSVYSGHVTYESRVSDDLPTVLHLSEKECFSPSQSSRHARYLVGQPIAVNNVDEDYRDVKCLLDFLHQAEVKSKIIAPIIVQDQLWGLLIAHQCRNYRNWQKSEAIFLQHIAEHLAVAISQASLYQQLRQQTVSLESCVIERTQSLHDALIAAESANITKDEFLSTMSHELRTPLTYIIGMSATLLRWSLGELNERQRSYLKTINQSGEQLLKVINDILEFASVESGRSLLDASTFSLSQFFERVVSSHQPMSKRQEVALSLILDVTQDDDWIEADAKRLQQIVDNLVHNAIKFTGAGGQVKVRVWRDAQFVMLQVEDTGIGIPESQQDDLFQKFKQLESPFQRQYSGTGLGLAMTKRLVELHGGTIQVHSKVAEGSVFTVRLPAHSELAESLEKRPQSLETTLQPNPKRVILLEVDENNAAIACEMLTAAGYEVIWLIESDQLADQLGTLKPALLIADLSLLSPDLRNIKTIQHTITALNTKVLAISAEQTFNHSAMAHHDILHKPLDPKALLGKVKQLA